MQACGRTRPNCIRGCGRESRGRTIGLCSFCSRVKRVSRSTDCPGTFFSCGSRERVATPSLIDHGSSHQTGDVVDTNETRHRPLQTEVIICILTPYYSLSRVWVFFRSNTGQNNVVLCIPSAPDMQQPKRAGAMIFPDREGKEGWVQR